MERKIEPLNSKTNISNLKSGIIRILLANILNLIFSLGTNFLLPKMLTIGSYAQIKSYQLYVSYIAVLQLGYSDGMYLKFGGKELFNIPNDSLQEDISTLRVFQGIIAVISLTLALIIQDPVLIVASLSVFPQNIVAYYKNLYQAVGRFSDYSRVMNMTTGLTFAINIFLLFIVKVDYYIWYIVSYLILSLVLMLFLEIQTNKVFNIKFGVSKFSSSNLILNVKNGFLLLLANFSSILLTSMDRVFTKVLLGDIDFAVYSFAVSIENFLNVAVSPLSVTLYNFFCNNKDQYHVERIRNMIILFSAFLISSAFPVKLIIELFLPHYIKSVMIVFFLFSAQMFLIVVRSVYSNLYKAFKMQNKYFIRMCIVIVVALILNFMMFYILHTMDAFAIGTVLSSVIWLVISCFDFKQYRFGLNNAIFVSVAILSFCLCGKYIGAIMGFLVYVSTIVVIAYILLRDTFYNLYSQIKSMLFKKAIVRGESNDNK